MKRNYIVMMALTTIFASCNDKEVFEREMYKNVVALISSDQHNIFKEEVQLTGDEVIGYIAASSGGTHAPDKDLLIGLQEDPQPLAAYNFSTYDAAEHLYAKALPKSKYQLMDDKIVIKAGELTGRIMVKLRPDGLSPDSSYFIGLKASDASTAEINPKKKSLLYQVIIANQYASQAVTALYSMTGMSNGLTTAANKQLFPLTKSSVRMIAGSETFVSKVPDIEKTAVILEIGADNRITIKPYKDILITQLDADEKYTNEYKVEESIGKKYHLFLLHYKYTIDGKETIMKEELRIEIKK